MNSSTHSSRPITAKHVASSHDHLRPNPEAPEADAPDNDEPGQRRARLGDVEEIGAPDDLEHELDESKEDERMATAGASSDQQEKVIGRRPPNRHEEGQFGDAPDAEDLREQERPEDEDRDGRRDDGNRLGCDPTIPPRPDRGRLSVHLTPPRERPQARMNQAR